MTSEDKIRLVVEADTSAVHDLNEQFAYTEAALKQLERAFQAGDITREQYLKANLRLKTTEFELRDAIAAKTAAVQKNTAAMQAAAAAAAASTTAMASAGQSNINFGRTAYVASQGIEDLQYGVNGVVNNIPQFVMALGGGAGLTAAISLAAVGVNQLVKHWDEWGQLIGAGHTKTEAEAMEELGKKTERTAEETAKLNRYKREQAEIESLRAAIPKDEKTRKGMVEEALGEAGLDTTARALVGARNPNGLEGRLSPDDREKLKSLDQAAREQEADGDRELATVLRNQAAEIRRAARDAEIRRAEADIAKAPLDADAHRGLVNEMDRAPGKFDGDLRAALTRALPENLREEKEGRKADEQDRKILEEDKKLEEFAKKAAEAAKQKEAERQHRLDQVHPNFSDFEGGLRKQKQEAEHHQAEVHPNFSDFDHQNRMEEAARDKAAAKAGRDDARDAKNAPKAARKAQVAEISQFVRANAMNPMGGQFTPQQADKAGERAVDLMETAGVPAMQAALVAVQEQNANFMRVQGQLNHLLQGFQQAGQAARRMGGRNN